MERLIKWLVWIKEHKRDWPLFVSAIIFGLNTELVVTPYILDGLLGLSGRELRFWAGAWSTIEMPWWIYFSIWLAKEKMKNLGRSRLIDIFRPQEKDYFWLTKFKELFNKYIIEKFDLENYRSDRLFRAISDYLRGYGYLANFIFIFIFSLIPGYWVLALMVCRITRWWSLYAVLFVGNFLKNYFFAYVYELTGFWWLLALIFLTLIFVGIMIKKIVINLGEKL